MTVREGWPPFEVWQQRRFILPRGWKISRLTNTTVILTADVSRFGIEAGRTAASLKQFANGYAAPFKPKYGRGHWLGFHNKCSPIICEKAAKLCNEAESAWRMEEYLAEKNNPGLIDSYLEYEAGVKIDPTLADSSEWWDS